MLWIFPPAATLMKMEGFAVRRQLLRHRANCRCACIKHELRLPSCSSTAGHDANSNEFVQLYQCVSARAHAACSLARLPPDASIVRRLRWAACDFFACPHSLQRWSGAKCNISQETFASSYMQALLTKTVSTFCVTLCERSRTRLI